MDTAVVVAVTAKKDPTIENINALDATAQVVMVSMMIGGLQSYNDKALFEWYLNLYSSIGVNMEGTDNMTVITAANTLVSLKIASVNKVCIDVSGLLVSL